MRMTSAFAEDNAWIRTVTVSEGWWGLVLALAAFFLLVSVFLIFAVRSAEKRADRNWEAAEAAIDLQPGLRGKLEMEAHRQYGWNHSTHRLLRDFRTARAKVNRVDTERSFVDTMLNLTKETPTS